MKKAMAIAVVAALGWVSQVQALEWTSDFEAALKASAETGKPVLADFTGSDWCSWCMRLESEVFGTDAFKNFAKENFVLFVADFPNEKQIPAAVAEQNRKLAEKYAVQGFPTLLILDKTGKEIARTGYRRGGAEAYIEHLKSLAPKTK